ncbi:hypothetical protein ES705_17295 [subsurface metagenome]
MACELGKEVSRERESGDSKVKRRPCVDHSRNAAVCQGAAAGPGPAKIKVRGEGVKVDAKN